MTSLSILPTKLKPKFLSQNLNCYLNLKTKQVIPCLSLLLMMTLLACMNLLSFCGLLEFAINQYFVEEKFPDLLKISKVCPVLTKEKRNAREKYKPISLLYYLSKICERTVHTILYGFIEEIGAFYVVRSVANHRSISIFFKLVDQGNDKISLKALFLMYPNYGRHA